MNDIDSNLDDLINLKDSNGNYYSVEEIVKEIQTKLNYKVAQRQVNYIKSNDDLLLLMRDYFLDRLQGNCDDIEKIKDIIKHKIELN